MRIRSRTTASLLPRIATGRGGRDGALRYASAAMAVPKQKQSHARTAQRRAQHKMAAPVFNACPQCHSPRRPHRVCPVCGHYAGREVVAPTAHDHHDH
jgi:large subunit ribosomal protein L32